MSANPLAYFRNLGLGTRIALTMFAAMLAIQVLNSALFLLLPRPHFKVYSARWIVAETVKVASALAEAAPSAQQEIAKRFLLETELTLRSQPQRPPSPQRREFPALHRLAASLSDALAGKIRNIEVRGHWGPPGPPPDAEAVMVPPAFASSLPRGALSPAEPDIAIWGRFEWRSDGDERGQDNRGDEPRDRASDLIGPH
jgi:hypothetical protein